MQIAKTIRTATIFIHHLTVLLLSFICQHLVHYQPGRFPVNVETRNGRENQHDDQPQNNPCQRKTEFQRGVYKDHPRDVANDDALQQGPAEELMNGRRSAYQ